MRLNISKLDPEERLRGILRLYPHALAYLFHPPRLSDINRAPVAQVGRHEAIPRGLAVGEARG